MYVYDKMNIYNVCIWLIPVNVYYPNICWYFQMALQEEKKQKISKAKMQKSLTTPTQRSPDALYTINSTYAKLGW